MDSESSESAEILSGAESDFEIVEKVSVDIPASESMDPLAPPAPLPDFVVSNDVSTKERKPVPDKDGSIVKVAEKPKEPATVVTHEPKVMEISGVTIVEEEEKNEPTMSSIFSWVRSSIPMPTMPAHLPGRDIMDRITEKAKTTMDSVITTLDPQMKEIINSGGDIEIIVTSMNEEKLSGVRLAFQDVFGKATVRGLKSHCKSVAPQPVGLISATQAVVEKEAYLRSSGFVHHQQPVLSVQNFLLEVVQDKWYILNLVYLSDPSRNITMQTLSQPVEVPANALEICLNSNVPGFKLASTGYAMTVAHSVAQDLGCAPSDWYKEACGVEKREIISLAVRALASMYRKATCLT